MKTLPTLNCVYPDLVLRLLPSWPTVSFFQYASDRPVSPPLVPSITSHRNSHLGIKQMIVTRTEKSIVE